MKKTSFLIALFATVIQCYDYALFGLSAGILSKTFMPTIGADKQLLFFFGILNLSVLAKPIGALIFGYIGDYYGRAYGVKIATFLAIISTSSIALIPSYDQIGIYSVVILTLARMSFLMSQAGEIDLTRIYIVEQTKNHKNFAGGLVSFSSQIGVLIAAFNYYYVEKLDISYLWRFNFLLGAICGAIVIFFRKDLRDENNLALKSADILKKKLSLFKIIKLNKMKFLLAIILSGACGGGYHFLIIFFNIFATKILQIINPQNAQILNILLIISYAISTLFSGALADYFNPCKQMIISLILSIAIILLLKFNINNSIPIWPLLLILLASLLSFYTIPIQIIIQSLFTHEIKARLCSLTHSLGSIIFSSSIPFLSMLIWHKSSSIMLVLGIYITLIVVILLAILMLSKNFFDKEINN